MIWWQDAYHKAKEADTAPYVPLGGRGRYLEARRKALANRRRNNLFRDPGERG